MFFVCGFYYLIKHLKGISRSKSMSARKASLPETPQQVYVQLHYKTLMTNNCPVL